MSKSVIIYSSEEFKVNLGGSFFFHSKKERSFHVPVDAITLEGPNYLIVRLSKTSVVCLLHSEIKEIQFV